MSFAPLTTSQKPVAPKLSLLPAERRPPLTFQTSNGPTTGLSGKRGGRHATMCGICGTYLLARERPKRFTCGNVSTGDFPVHILPCFPHNVNRAFVSNSAQR